MAHQQGHFELKAGRPDGTRLSAYRYRVGERGRSPPGG